ncbi:MAG: SDR family oxidoreductase [Planctomycetia bacterium]|nr:SDR family oxidoreductase [Planctomycetia bacterium]
MSVFDQFRLTGRRALITGGSRGLGRAMAQALAEAGADLVLIGRTTESLERAKAELETLSCHVEVVTADVSEPETASLVCSEVLKRGNIDILINNVGGRREDIPTAEMPLDAWRRYLDLNLTSAVACTTAVVGPMLERGWGRVVNIASIAGPLIAFKGIQGRHYETAKAALAGYTRAAAADWAARGVTVNAVCPGVFFTEANRRWASERLGWREAVESNIPARRMGEAAEIAPLVLYLCSPASAYMTGAMLVIDGGYTLW